MRELDQKLNCLGVFSSAQFSAAIEPFRAVLNAVNEGGALQAAAKIYSRLVADGQVFDLARYFFEVLKSDCNPLSLCFLKGEAPSKQLLDRAKTEYGYLCCAAELDVCAVFNERGFCTGFLPDIKGGKMPPFSALLNSYKKDGCGVFCRSNALIWNEDKKDLEPLVSTPRVRFSDLKEYNEEKQAVKANTEAFLNGLPAVNVLLYGDRGTGKSSTVHALLTEYADRGLRLIELTKSAVNDYKRLAAIAAQTKFKFIVFIDDLSFAEGENGFAALKAALEGSLSRADNILIYATTNRRHLIRESHTERAGEVHLSDTVEEQMSLADRFGLVVTFQNPSKAEFLDILRQILADKGVILPDDKLELYAERYAIKKGGRSPRAAKQLADMLIAGAFRE